MQDILMIILIVTQAFLVLALFILKSNLQQQNQLNLEKVDQKNNHMLDRLDLRINDLLERNANFERTTTQNLQNANQVMVQRLNEHFFHQQKTIESRLDKIDLKVNESLQEGFEKTHNTFTNIVSRLTKIDEAQKKIDALSVEIVSLQDVLTDKSTRGAFGEIQLNQILKSIFGEKNDRIYQTQYTFSNGKRADAVLFAPEPLGTLAIDSKFPLENYQRLIQSTPNSKEFHDTRKLFVADVKKHIDDICARYIIEGETSNQAILFVPAEAVFAHINAYHPDIIAYSQQKRVWLTSPTTLMSTLTTIQTILINMERDKYTHEIQTELKKLELEFTRYKQRWDSLAKRLDQVGSDVKDIHVTTDKITKRFESISSVQYDEID